VQRKGVRFPGGFDYTDSRLSQQYQEYFDDTTGKGFQPTQICAYPWEDEVRYLAVFVKGEK
jgi:hypothetical protein